MNFPREVWWGSHLETKGSLPRQIVNDRQEYLEFIRLNNNKVNCYTSVYDYKMFGDSQAITTSVILDRLFLDFDSHNLPLESSFEDFRLVIDYLLQKDYIFDMAFSGNGFHIFVYGEVTNTMRNIRQFFNVIRHQTKNNTLDNRVIDSRRLRRIPNTVNMKTEECLYCIPLEKEHLRGGLNLILDLARKPTFSKQIRYGNRLVHWPQAPTFQATPIEIGAVERVGKLPILPCLKNSVMIENPTHTTRYYLVSWYRTLLAEMLYDQKKIYDDIANKVILEWIIEEIKSIV